MGAVAGERGLAAMWSMADRRDANCATAHRNIAMAAVKVRIVNYRCTFFIQMHIQWTTVSIEIT